MANSSIRSSILISTILLICISVWLHKINTILPEPYLDEVFHVRQAQTYWKHQWKQWDPKITTPPGLYIFSYLIGGLWFLVFRKPAVLSAVDLRCMNGLILFNTLPLVLRRLLKKLRKSPSLLDSGKCGTRGRISSWEVSFTVLNVCLFPPIFFFSGLYYTDIASLLVVMEVYRRDLKQVEVSRDPFRARDGNTSGKIPFSSSTILITVLGALSLLFRQTNIFWTAVFLGGLRIIRTLHSFHTDIPSSSFLSVVTSSWNLRQLYDPPVSEALFEDYFKAGVSIAVAALAHVRIIFAALLPYLITLSAFVAFVIWNGGVVLGHKEFHTAGLHLPQMLYIWPYFMFFSWPILITPWVASLYRASSSRNHSRDLFEALPRLSISICFTAAMLLAVHFNTIVHPFTLADNRHYVFYIFRIFLRKPFIKYAITPIYTLCGWAVISAFSGPPSRLNTDLKPEKVDKPENPKSTSESRSFHRTSSMRVSFVLVWLASTTLSLITAPLVEPRYFIIPWVLWRIHVPPSAFLLDLKRHEKKNENGKEKHSALSQSLRYSPLILEILWFMAINAATGYMFLYRGFEWRQEPGRLQRFMW